MFLKKFSDLAEKVILKSIKKSDNDGRNYLLYKLAVKWQSIVGNEIASMMRVSTISLDNKGKCLILKILNPSYIAEANMYKFIVQQRINTYFGENVIVDVKVSL